MSTSWPDSPCGCRVDVVCAEHAVPTTLRVPPAVGSSDLRAKLEQNAKTVNAAVARIDLRENDVVHQQCILRLSMGELGALNELLASLLAEDAPADQAGDRT